MDVVGNGKSMESMTSYSHLCSSRRLGNLNDIVPSLLIIDGGACSEAKATTDRGDGQYFSRDP